VESEGQDVKPTRSGPPELWALVERIAASRSFGRAERLKDLLVYLTERTSSQPGTEVQEHEIRTAVFGRAADASTREDTIVRVQVSKLRKKLEDYFASEGADEASRLEIPRGQYAVTWRPRGEVSGEAGHEDRARGGRLAPLAFAVSVAAALGLGLAAGLLLRAAPRPVTTTPALDSLWSQIFRKDQQTDIILADSTLTLVQDILHRSLTLDEYMRWDSLMQAPAASPEADAMMRATRGRRHTSMADAVVVQDVSRLDRGTARQVTLIFARDFHARHFAADNVVLLGSPRSNPWLELFQPAMALRFRWDETDRHEYIVDLTPPPGGAAEYRLERSPGQTGVLRPGYGIVAFLPNLERQRSVLVIAGTDMEATGAGGHLVTNEAAVVQLRERLHVAPGTALPHFEALLSTRKIGGTAPSYEILLARPIP